MTKITVEASEMDFNPFWHDRDPNFPLIGPQLAKRMAKAYQEAKEKEIKVGDWVYNKEQNVATTYAEYHQKEDFIKLPQNIQEGLNEFIKSQE